MGEWERCQRKLFIFLWVIMLCGFFFPKSQVKDKRSLASCEAANQLTLDSTVLWKQFLLCQDTVQHHPHLS